MVRDEPGAGGPEGVPRTDQQRQLPFLSGVLPGFLQRFQNRLLIVGRLQRVRIEGRQGGDRKLRRQRQLDQLGMDQRLPVDAPAERRAQGGAGEEPPLRGIEPDKLQHACGLAGTLGFARNQGGVLGGVHRKQLDAPGGEEIQRGIPVLGIHQRDGFRREALLLPPVLPGLEISAAAVVYQPVGPGAHRNRLSGGCPLDNRDIQQGRQSPVGGGEGNDHLPRPVGGGGDHVPQPVGIPLRLLSPLEGFRRVPGRKQGAVGEGYALPERQRTDQPGAVPAKALAQHRLRLETPVQYKQRLIEQGRRRLLNPFAAGDRVQGVIPVVGQRESGGIYRLRRLLLFVRLLPGELLVVLPLLFQLIRLRQGGAAAQEQHRCQQKGKAALHPRPSSPARAMRAPWTPLRSPVIRWLQ